MLLNPRQLVLERADSIAAAVIPYRGRSRSEVQRLRGPASLERSVFRSVDGGKSRTKTLFVDDRVDGVVAPRDAFRRPDTTR
jgi:hypothetical protein